MSFLILRQQGSQNFVTISSNFLRKFWHLTGIISIMEIFTLWCDPPVNITPLITQLTGILNGDLEDCQEFSVVGKEFIVFLKDKLDEQG